MKREDESHWLLKAQAGDRDAFASLVRHHLTWVRGVCLSFLKNPLDADEAAQAIFVRVFQTLASFRGKSTFSTWLYRLTVNHCLDVRRRLRRESSLFSPDLNTAPEMAHPSENLSRTMEENDFIQRALAHLSDTDRSILVLREIQGLSYEDIARCLGLSLEAVRSRLRRARVTLAQKARHFWEGTNV